MKNLLVIDMVNDFCDVGRSPKPTERLREIL